MPTLYIKVGGCYLCLRAHMLLEVFKQYCQDTPGLSSFDYNLQTIGEKEKLTAYNLESPNLPVLLDEFEYEDGEQIEAHLIKRFHENVKYELQLECTDDAILNLTRKSSPISEFNKWMKGTSNNTYNLRSYLERLDDVLGRSAQRGDFLDGNKLKFEDCILLPKLDHMRVVGKYITQEGGDIFKGYTNITRYLKKAENGTVFASTKRDIDVRKWDSFKGKKKASDISKQ